MVVTIQYVSLCHVQQSCVFLVSRDTSYLPLNLPWYLDIFLSVHTSSIRITYSPFEYVLLYKPFSTLKRTLLEDRAHLVT